MRRLVLALLVFSAIPSHAGWFQEFCERHLIADDPYQFESYSLETLAEMYQSEGATCSWRKQKTYRLRILGQEIRRRLRSSEIEIMLENYKQFEK